MKVVTKKAKLVKASEIPVGECFKMQGAPDYIYMRVSPLGFDLADKADMVLINLNTGDVGGWAGDEHNVHPIQAKVVEE